MSVRKSSRTRNGARWIRESPTAASRWAAAVWSQREVVHGHTKKGAHPWPLRHTIVRVRRRVQREFARAARGREVDYPRAAEVAEEGAEVAVLDQHPGVCRAGAAGGAAGRPEGRAVEHSCSVYVVQGVFRGCSCGFSGGVSRLGGSCAACIGLAEFGNRKKSRGAVCPTNWPKLAYLRYNCCCGAAKQARGAERGWAEGVHNNSRPNNMRL